MQRISFVSLPVSDQDRAIDFYTSHLGFAVQTDAPYTEGWRWIFLTLPDAETRLHFARRGEVTFNEVPALALTTEDVDADCARWRAAGVTITGGPDDAPWQPGVRWATLRDSEGNLVFVESKKP
ncbi:MAG: VOC family protein [Pseudomonadota bacterium]